MSDLVTVEEIQILTQGSETPPTVVVTAAEQGPPGPPGDPSGAFLVANRLSELAADPTAQIDAQQNIGLGAVDPLAYYILAKA